MTETTPRILPLPKEEWTDAARDVFAFWGEPNAREVGSVSNLVMVQAHHPKLALAYNVFGKHLLLDSTLPARPRELVVLRTSWRLKSAYEWHYHVGYALKIGVTLEEIAAIKEFPAGGDWNEQDHAVLTAVDELLQNNCLSDASWAKLTQHFDKQQIMDFIFTVGNYTMLSWTIAVLGVQLEDNVNKIGYDLKTETGDTPTTGERPGESKDWAANNAAKGKKV